ncbi:MAG: hypothetical protein AAGF11_13700 [Myxococcota bacterium]
MTSSATWITGGIGLLVGLGLGWWLGARSPSAEPAVDAAPPTSTRSGHGAPEARRDGDAPSVSAPDRAAFDPEASARHREVLHRRQRVAEAETNRRTPGEGAEGRDKGEGEGAPPGERSPAEQIEQLRAEVLALREERDELMGQPIPTPAEVAPRLQGPALNGAVQQALAGEDVEGQVEAVDCSEHPCIVFGRLQGDEEDMEEVERAKALSPYEDDVLSLLFWATSVDKEEGAPAAETGLFALAYYTAQERAQQGESLERRIRARVMEFWNHDRPGASPDAAGHVP